MLLLLLLLGKMARHLPIDMRILRIRVAQLLVHHLNFVSELIILVLRPSSIVDFRSHVLEFCLGVVVGAIECFDMLDS